MLSKAGTGGRRWLQLGKLAHRNSERPGRRRRNATNSNNVTISGRSTSPCSPGCIPDRFRKLVQVITSGCDRLTVVMASKLVATKLVGRWQKTVKGPT
jgi:hypothetical protein